jgi:DNA (cytosine-5)-methyltransferase 1
MTSSALLPRGFDAFDDMNEESAVGMRTYDRKMRVAARYRLTDLFAGCGGMTRGFHDAGRFTSVFAVESDHDAAASYRANFPGVGLLDGRIEEVTEFPEVDVVIGGPPCQGFSTLNRQGAGLERRKLWRQYTRALEASNAIAFVMEQVPQLLDSRECAALIRAARKLDFEVDARVLNAADFGVPQKRKRAFVIGLRGARPAWPGETHSDPRGPERDCPPWRSFRDAVEGLPIEPDGRNWHRRRNPRAESILRYRAVPQDGGNRFEMERNLENLGRPDLILPCFKKKPTGTTDVFGRLWWDRPAVTIRTEFYKPEKGRYLHPVADRPITVREAARCMSFTDDFVFPEEQSMTSVGRQIGNAVPPELARQVASTLADQLDLLFAANCAA